MAPKTTPALSVAIATHDMVPALFMYDLAQLTAFTMASIPEKVPYGINMVSGTYIHRARQQLLENLIADGTTHILWMDSDMRFPRNSFIRLLNHNQPVVGVNYAKRQVPTDYVAIKKVGFGDGGKRLVTDGESTGLEKVEAVGFGLLLMRVDALLELPTDQPWFWYELDEETGDHIGEDVYFCRLLRESGVDIYVDHDLSKECAHVGQFEYTLNLVNPPEELIVSPDEAPQLELVT